MGPSSKISIVGVFCLSVFLIPSLFDLALAAPAENSIENSDSNGIGNLSLPREERGDYFEGDIILPDFEKLGLRAEASRWADAIIIYKLDSKFTRGEKKVIEGAMSEISEKTCVQFQPRTSESAYVSIVRGERGSGCNAHVGFHGNVQRINLEPEYPQSPGTCIDHGVVIHEILHTLGFYHEQSRTDRDDFVTINMENVKPDSFTVNFQKYGSKTTTDFGISYDYGSIMHYGPFAFAVNSSVPTITPKRTNVKIGQRVELSDKDVQKIIRMYSKNHQKCFNLMMESKMEIQEKQLVENEKKMKEMAAELKETKQIANSYAQTYKARLYSKPNFTGAMEDYNVSPFHYDAGCYNLKNISANVKSIQTFNTCVRLFNKPDCAGSMRAYLPGLNNPENIPGSGSTFNVVSIGPCFEVPHFGRSIETLKNAVATTMYAVPRARLYSGLNRTGEEEEYNTGYGYDFVPCYNVTKLAGKVKSVDNLGSCVRLFKKPDCSGGVYVLSPLVSLSIKDNIQSVLPTGVASVAPCWEAPYGQRSLYKLRSSLDNIISKS